MLVLLFPQRRLTPRLFHEITQAFKAAVATTKGDNDGADPSKYKVIDAAGELISVLLCEINPYLIWGEGFQLLEKNKYRQELTKPVEG